MSEPARQQMDPPAADPTARDAGHDVPDSTAANPAQIEPGQAGVLPEGGRARESPLTPDESPSVSSVSTVTDEWARPAEPSAEPDTEATPSDPEAASRARPLPRINIQAFCEEQATAEIVQRVSYDRRLAKAHVTVQMGGVEAAIAFYKNAPTPNLIIIESTHNRDALLTDLDRLAEVCDAGTKVMVIGHVNDVLLYRELLHRGVSEYLVMPLTVPQVMESLSSLYTDPASDPLGHVIAFVGAKGGAGSSTVCHNTAWAISQGVKSDVVIADFDLPFGTAGLDFNQDPVQGLADALLSPDRLDEVLLDRLLSRCSDYLSLFAAPGTLDRSYDVTTEACDVVVDVLRRNVPHIAVDIPHLWTDWAQQVIMQADHVVLTAEPDLANLRNAKNLCDKLASSRPNDVAPLLVLNQVGVPKRPEISVRDFASAIEVEPSAVIEFDSQLFGTATNNGQMIEEVSSKARAAEQFRELALALTDRTAAKLESRSLLAPILERLSLRKARK